jgi:hypothetical protein
MSREPDDKWVNGMNPAADRAQIGSIRKALGFSAIRPFNSVCSISFGGFDETVLILKFDTKEQRDHVFDDWTKNKEK